MERLRVLIVEDDRDTAEFFQRVLSLFGFDCELVMSAKKALSVLATSVPDVILLDLRLGSDIGGEDILFQVRSNPRMSRTRVIVITAYPSETEMVSNLADLILVKPVEVDQLRRLVGRLGAIEASPRQSQFQDPVTELYNQEFFFTRLELAFERSKRRSDFLYAVIVFEIKVEDGLEQRLSPDAHISLLRAVSGRLRFSSRPMDTLARLADMKFALLNEELQNPEDVHQIIRRIQEKLSEPFLVEGEMIKVRVNFGGAFHTPHWSEYMDVLEAAEQALEVAQAKGPDEIYLVGLPSRMRNPAQSG